MAELIKIGFWLDHRFPTLFDIGFHIRKDVSRELVPKTEATSALHGRHIRFSIKFH